MTTERGVLASGPKRQPVHETPSHPHIENSNQRLDETYTYYAYSSGFGMAGYDRLASLMGAYSEVAIFRRFGALNAQNLLYLQAELTSLELDFRRIAQADAISGHQDRTLYSRDWQTLSESINAPGGNDAQWTTFLRIREKLKEYSESSPGLCGRSGKRTCSRLREFLFSADAAILEQNELAKLSPPNPRDFRFLVNWMKHPRMGNVYLLGADSDIWEKPEEQDMISLDARRSNDSFSRLVTDRLIHSYHHLCGWRIRKPRPADWTSNTVYYSQKDLLRFSRVVITIIASILPVLSIVILYLISSMRQRLGIVGLFTTIFSFSLCTFTDGRPIEIFAAAAAYVFQYIVSLILTAVSNRLGLTYMIVSQLCRLFLWARLRIYLQLHAERGTCHNKGVHVLKEGGLEKVECQWCRLIIAAAEVTQKENGTTIDSGIARSRYILTI